MAYPPRPGMMPGLPPFGMMPIGAPPPNLRFRGPPPSVTRTAPPIMNADVPSGPPVTVFVGNITERAQDAMVRHLLTSCGPIITWKRVQGATGRLQGFGFCEYANPDAAARSIRLLHDMLIVDKKLVVKVDAKTKDVLAEYKKQRRKNMTGKSPTQEESDRSDDDFIDAAMKHEDQMALERFKAIMMDHNKEMMNYVPHEARRHDKRRDDSAQTGPKESLDDVEMEDGKRDIIHREIDKFRETMKIREAEKEEEKKKREKTDDVVIVGAVTGSGSAGGGGAADSKRSMSRRSRDRSKVSTRRSVSRSRTPTPPPVSVRRGERDSRSRSHRPPPPPRRRSRSNSRSRSRERRSRERGRSSKEVLREREKEEEEKELRRAERKAREKEASYQERLRKWESRESKMQKEHEKEKQKEEKRLEDMDKEGKKLREFLEDYDDDRDDEKYYKGRELERRLFEREREALKDAEDRQREKEEIEELKVQIAQEGFRDPAAELHRRIAEQSGGHLTDPRENGVGLQSHQDVEILGPPTPAATLAASNPILASFHESIIATPSPGIVLTPSFNLVTAPVPPPSVILPPLDNQDESDDDHYEPMENAMDEDEEEENQPQISIEPPPPQMMKQPLHVSGRRKLDVRDVFNQEDDDASVSSKKKKLPPLSSDRNKKEDHKSTEDKRKHIKTLIEKIPTDKNALFEYQVDWDMVDNQLMEKRIRPWVNKKIAEYIGEPEPTLTEFICSKVLAGSSPKAVLEDVQMVLDEEAEVFVVKMWRLLIYEIENKKHKSTGGASSNA